MKETSNINVAYADNHTAVRKGIVTFIEKFGGITVDIEADHGKDLIKQLEKASKQPDIVMLDIHMPYMDGFETVTALKEKWTDIKILVLTAYETEVYLIQMINMGVNGYLLKSCHPQTIKIALESIHDYSFYYTDATEEHFFKKVQRGEIKIPHFTDRELEYLKFCPTDLNYNQIAVKMGTTVKAIDGYTARLCEKLHVKGRIGLAMCAIHFGFVKVDMKHQNKFILNHKKHRS